MNAITIGLVLLLVGLVVYVVGVDRTRDAASRTASGTKRVATSSVTMIGAGAAGGLAAGDAIAQFLMQDPGTIIAGVTGILGYLGLSGELQMTPLQYALIVVVLIIGFAAWRTD